MASFRYVTRKFSNQYKATIGADFLTKEVRELFDYCPSDVYMKSGILISKTKRSAVAFAKRSEVRAAF